MYDDAFGYWLTGLTDGEGCFHGRITISRIGSPTIDVLFAIKLRADDHLILEQTKRTLGVGRLYSYQSKGARHPYVEYSVHRLQDLTQVIIPHFERYPLQTKKGEDFAIWRTLVVEYKTKGKKGTYLTEQTVREAASLCHQLKQVREFKLEDVPSYPKFVAKEPCCVKCKETDEKQFSKRLNDNGYQSYCKQCMKDYMRIRRS